MAHSGDKHGSHSIYWGKAATDLQGIRRDGDEPQHVAAAPVRRRAEAAEQQLL